MNRGHVMKRWPVQQTMGGGANKWWNIKNMRPPPPLLPNSHHEPSPFLVPHSLPQLNSSSWLAANQDQLPDQSWCQLLLGGMVGEEEKSTSSLSKIQVAEKNLENWEERVLNQGSPSMSLDIVKQEASSNSYSAPAYYRQGSMAQATEPTSCSPLVNSMTASSPKSSCVTSLSSKNKCDSSHPPPDLSSECNSTASGGATKKARVQQASSTQSNFRVRKEKIGDRITSLHQLVSPFGKTDTASVLLEVIGYIRFLQSQIEALSLPYFGNGSGNMKHQPSGQGEMVNCLFPEEPGQLLNDNCMKKKGASDQDSNEVPKKDLKSRGLCLAPVSCTMQVESENGANYWAPAVNGGLR